MQARYSTHALMRAVCFLIRQVRREVQTPFLQIPQTVRPPGNRQEFSRETGMYFAQNAP
jgi:hypothetical protein